MRPLSRTARAFLLLVALTGTVPFPSAEATDLKSVSITAATKYAGRTETWTVQFTTHLAVPARGDVVVEFPVGFKASAATATCEVLIPTNIASQYANVLGDRTVACELGEGGALNANTLVQITFNKIRNPFTAGRVTPFHVYSRDADDDVIDTFVDSTDKLKIDILPEPILDVSVTAPQRRTSLIETHTVTFHAVQAVPSWGEVNVTVPDTAATSADFQYTGIGSECDFTAPATVVAPTTYVEGRSVHCQLGPGDSIAAGAAVTLTITKIRNPPLAGLTSPWSVQTRNVSGAAKLGVMDGSTAFRQTIIANRVTGASVVTASSVAGVAGTVTVTGTPFSAVPGRGDIRIVLPPGYRTNVGGSTVCDITAPTTVHAETTKLVSTNEVDCELGPNDSIANATAITLTLSRIGNPTTARAGSSFLVQTRNAADALQDENSTASPAIVANTLANVLVAAPQQKMASTETWTFRFRPFNPVASTGDVRIVFPTGFQLSTGNVSTCRYTVGGTGGVGRVVSSTEFVCSGVALAAGVDASFEVTKVRNPLTAGTTGAFTLETRNATGALHDAFSGQAATIVVAPLPGLKITTAAHTTGTVENQTIEFTVSRVVPVGGDIRVVFPAGYVISSGAATVCKIVTPTNATTGTTTLTPSSAAVCNLPANVSIPASTAVKLVLTKVKTPTVAGVTGAFLVETRNAADALIEQNATVRVTILPHAFAAGPNHTGPNTAKTTGDHVFGVTLANAWEAAGQLRLVVPDENKFDGAGAGSTRALFTAGGSGTFLPPSIDNGTAVFTRSGGGVLPAGSVLSIKVTSVRNGNVSADGGTFLLETLDAAEGVHDSGSVAGPAIVAATAKTTAKTGATGSKPPAASSGSTDKPPAKKKSPAPEFGPALAILLALVIVARRRRDA